jgi:hypothetical protein
MSVAAETQLCRPVPGTVEWNALRFRPSRFTWWMADADGDRQVSWQVKVQPEGHLITRHVWCSGQAWDHDGHRWAPERVIWPGWSANSKEERDARGSPLSDMQEYWSTAGNRLRDSAKWLATALGAALASLIGTSPLADMRGHQPRVPAMVLAAGGLILLGFTLFLALQVMRPQSVSFNEVESARARRYLPQRSIFKLRRVIDSHQDLYLPCGVWSLTALRQSMIIEEATLMALADAIASAADLASAQALDEAKAARASRLLQLRLAASRIASIGEYYKLRSRSSCAIFLGVPSGILATAAIGAAFVWSLH